MDTTTLFVYILMALLLVLGFVYATSPSPLYWIDGKHCNSKKHPLVPKHNKKNKVPYKYRLPQ